MCRSRPRAPGRTKKLRRLAACSSGYARASYGHEQSLSPRAAQPTYHPASREAPPPHAGARAQETAPSHGTPHAHRTRSHLGRLCPQTLVLRPICASPAIPAHDRTPRATTLASQTSRPRQGTRCLQTHTPKQMRMNELDGQTSTVRCRPCSRDSRNTRRNAGPSNPPETEPRTRIPRSSPPQ